jgi:anti-sigma regulatory factor (Ser/Thr protein kinase)
MQFLSVPGTLDSLKPIADFVLAAATEIHLDKKAAYKLRLAVDEVATNIILHGYEEAGLAGTIQLSVTIDDQNLEIILEDQAIPYNPLQAESVEAEELQRPLAERRMGGLGVFLAIEGVDQFRYERINERNRNIFTVNRPQAVVISHTGDHP